jgi:aryl-phospho-beta-D-glucosidase BglC (GH1 family)
MALWDDRNNQLRLISLWRAIANHCKSKLHVAAYDLLNEPFPRKTVTQWKLLAEELKDAIRSVDSNPLIIVERVNSVKERRTVGANSILSR